MKVLMTTDVIGGVWTYCLELCDALAVHGVEVGLATLGGELSATQRDAVGALDNVTLFESHYRLCWMADAWDDVYDSRAWLRQLEREFKPDVVHLNDLGAGAGFTAPALLVAHSCVLSWWRAVEGVDAPAQWARYQAEVRACAEAAALVVAPSYDMLRAFETHYGPLPAKTVIGNGRSFPALAKPATLAKKQPQILTAGRLWDASKNLAALAAVAPDLPWPVFAAGSGDGSPAPLGVELLGQLSAAELGPWLHASAIYVAPARYEPFGLANLEAARAGCALVLGDIASLREVWGEAASFVPPNDPQKLRRAVLELIENPGLRQNQAQAALSLAQTYSAQRMALAYLRRYQKLAAPSRTRMANLAGALS